MEKNLRLITQKKLQEKYIKQGFDRIPLCEDNDVAILLFMNSINLLIREGQTDEELFNLIKENFKSSVKLLNEQEQEGGNAVVDYLSNLFNKVSGQNVSNDQTQDTMKTIGRGGFSQIKEFLIGQGIGLIGFKGPLAKAVSTLLADLPIKDLIGFFTNPEYCGYVSKDISLGVLESAAAYFIESSTEDGSFIATFLRNQVTEFLREGTFGTKFGNMLCQAIHSGKMKEKINSTLQQFK